MAAPDATRRRIGIAVDDLCEILDRLSDLHESLYDTLIEKQDTLTQVRLDDLEEVRSDEEEILREIIDEEKERLLLTEEIGDLLDYEHPAQIRVDEICAAIDDTLASKLDESRRRLRSMALQLAQQNRRNRALIEHSLGHVRLFVSRLVNEEIVGASYGANGSKPNSGDASFLLNRRG